MSPEGFELHGTYDEDRAEFLDEEGNVTFVVNDPAGIANIDSFSLKVSDENLVRVWKAMGAAERLSVELGMDLVTVNLPISGMTAEPEESIYLRYDSDMAAQDTVAFQSQDKHSDITVETRSILLAEIEAYLVGNNLIDEADCRSDDFRTTPKP